MTLHLRYICRKIRSACSMGYDGVEVSGSDLRDRHSEVLAAVKQSGVPTLSVIGGIEG